MERRRLLQQALAIAGAMGTPLDRLGAIGRRLDEAFGERSVEDWEQVAYDYSCAVMTEQAATLADDLAADLGAVGLLLHRNATAKDAPSLQRVAAQLSVIAAMVQQNQGSFQRAGRWWCNAARAAELSGDRELHVLVLGRHAVRSIFAGRPPEAVVQLAEQALAVAGDSGTGEGVASARAAQAQALSLLGDGRAVDVLDTLADCFGRLPAAVTAEGVACIGYFRERNLRHTESFVCAHLDDRRAEPALERALALYPATLYREPANLELHRARRLVSTGDVRTGVMHAQDTVLGVPAPYRDHLLIWTAREFLNAVPAREQRSPAVMEYRELVAQSAAS
jgi:hypothetical protein